MASNDFNMEMDRGLRSSDSRGFLVYMNALNSITHLLLGATAFSAFIYATAASNHITIDSTVVVQWPAVYSQHIYLCVTGYIVLMAQGLLSFNPNAGFTTNLKYPQKRSVHITMQVIGSILAIAGSIMKLLDADPLFYSIHSIFGVLTLILTIISLIGGVLHVRLSARSLNLMHRGMGSLTVTFAFITLICAYALYISDGSQYLSLPIVVLTLVGLLTIVITKTVKTML